MAEDTEAVEVTAAGAEAGQDTEVAAVEAGAGAGLLELGAEVSWSSNIFFCLTQKYFLPGAGGNYSSAGGSDDWW